MYWIMFILAFSPCILLVFVCYALCLYTPKREKRGKKGKSGGEKGNAHKSYTTPHFTKKTPSFLFFFCFFFLLFPFPLSLFFPLISPSLHSFSDNSTLILSLSKNNPSLITNNIYLWCRFEWSSTPSIVAKERPRPLYLYKITNRRYTQFCGFL